MLAGFCVLLVMLFGWFGTVIGESEAPPVQPEGRPVVPLEHELVHLQRGDVLRRVLRRAVLRAQHVGARPRQRADRKLLWPDYAAQWPTVGPYIKQQFTPMGAIGIPLLNTIILVTSGGTLTIAHHALKAGHRGALKFWLFVTIVLGFTFLGFQAYEYTHAYSELNLKLSTGVYGSTFFMLTGFHGCARDDRRDHADR